MLRSLVLYDDGSVRPGVSYAIVALVVILGGYFVYSTWTGSDAPTEGTWACWECGYVAGRTPKIGDDLPGRCAKCGKQSFVPAYSCPNCDSLVALNEYRDLKPPTKCPKCGAEVWYGR